MAHWDPGKVLEPSIGRSGPCRALGGYQPAAVPVVFARIIEYFGKRFRLVSGHPRPPSAWNFRSECLGWLIGTQGWYQNRQLGGRGHVVRSGRRQTSKLWGVFKIHTNEHFCPFWPKLDQNVISDQNFFSKMVASVSSSSN